MERMIDANIVLRYLLKDDEVLYSFAKKYINKNSILLVAVLAEVVYVLNKVYHIERINIVRELKNFAKEIKYEEENVSLRTLDYYGNTKLDFIDCYLIARKEILNNEIITLDNNLLKEIKKL